MNILFEITDKTGRRIRMTKERWNHIQREHPQISNIEEIKNALEMPLRISPSKYNPEEVKWYYSFNKLHKLYLFVAVKYLNGEGFIITSYYVSRIK